MTLVTLQLLIKIANFSSHPWPSCPKSIMTLVTLQLLIKVVNFSLHSCHDLWQSSIMTLVTAQIIIKVANFSSHPWPSRYELLMALITTHIMIKVANFSSRGATVSDHQSWLWLFWPPTKSCQLFFPWPRPCTKCHICNSNEPEKKKCQLLLRW